ncbi:MAG: hypothetical protein ACOC29_00410 [Candidatus Sumerlaeota bacterium]
MLSEYRMLEAAGSNGENIAPAPRPPSGVEDPEPLRPVMDPPRIRQYSEETNRRTSLPLHENPNAPEPWGESDVPTTPSTRRPLSPGFSPDSPRLHQSDAQTSPPSAPPAQGAPVASVLTIESESRTVPPDVLSVLTQVVWNEFQRTRHTRLQRLRYTRHVLSQYDLTPSDPYKVPPSPRQIAEALNADYLVMGSADKIENIHLMELFLYDARANRIIDSRAARSSQGYQDLLQQVPDIVRDLQESIPAFKDRDSADTGKESTASRGDDDVTDRLRALEMENARLREALMNSTHRQENMAERLDESDPGATVTPEPYVPEELPPARGGNKMRQRKKFPGEVEANSPADYYGAQAASAPSESTSPPSTPEPTPRATPEPTPEATPEPTPEATPEPSPVVSEEEMKERRKEAQGLYEEALRYPQDSTESLAPLRRAVELDEENTKYKETLIERLYSTGKYAECARLGEQFERQGIQSSMLALYTASAFTRLGEHEDAIEVLDRLLRREPENGYALYNKALNLSLMGRDVDAARAFERFLEVARGKPAFASWMREAENQLNKLR